MTRSKLEIVCLVLFAGCFRKRGGGGGVGHIGSKQKDVFNMILTRIETPP